MFLKTFFFLSSSVSHNISVSGSLYSDSPHTDFSHVYYILSIFNPRVLVPLSHPLLQCPLQRCCPTCLSPLLTQNSSDNRCPGRDLNRKPPEYEHEALTFGATFSVHSLFLLPLSLLITATEMNTCTVTTPRPVRTFVVLVVVVAVVVVVLVVVVVWWWWW